MKLFQGSGFFSQAMQYSMIHKTVNQS